MHPEELSVALFLFQFRGRVDLGTTLDHSRASPNLIPCQMKLRCFRRGQTPAVEPGAEQICRACQAPSQKMLFTSAASKESLPTEETRGKTFLLQPCLTRSLEQISVWACVIGCACSSCFLRLYLKRPEQKYYGKKQGREKGFESIVSGYFISGSKEGKIISQRPLQQVVTFKDSSVDFEAHRF